TNNRWRCATLKEADVDDVIWTDPTFKVGAQWDRATTVSWNKKVLDSLGWFGPITNMHPQAVWISPELHHTEAFMCRLEVHEYVMLINAKESIESLYIDGRKYGGLMHHYQSQLVDVITMKENNTIIAAEVVNEK
ncbi:hypothetical protein HELRODRAFT_184707, partial [Helobdella robusta]|uniref:Uncharacterized protein n=1 Tax=Helobdella robusta TaxID=6412 RepID=T1FLT7_HELRO